ncbi:UCH-domain-containing protein [Aulographum hederae CBS 113979]|uniref:ubiquitinyl hydrolase 1 n=1 Tax=Aulographum hederae CBS 113979 TaxID=1176131 RepID=A0A6G1H3Z6_9PEZI|nr:UCH-domain-containing protein [Aulographum hederae CBS 113979]
MLRVQQSQSELADRVARLERRQEDDARLKSVWGTSSPFPSVLSGTPQQAPLHQPPADVFTGFDDQSTNMIGSLHLDADDEPRRVGATSRANSVRFDESANQGHWSHASRSSVDLIPRTGSGLSGLGAHALTERSYSHRSDGRQSSAGHSVHSGRANSMGLDMSFTLGQANHSPIVEGPGLAPGLFILGSVPAIIRCWLNTNFKHDSLLYAAVCSGSFTSFLDFRLIERLGFGDQVTVDSEGARKIKLAMYFPEAVTHPASSRSSSPVPQLPTLTVEFTVVDGRDNADPKAIQIFIGSDVLRAHNADILFSSNSMTLYDDDRTKLSIPLIRPEDERTFKTLHVTSVPNKFNVYPKEGQPSPNGIERPHTLESSFQGLTSMAPQDQEGGRAAFPGVAGAEFETSKAQATGGERSTPVASEQKESEYRPSLSRISTNAELGGEAAAGAATAGRSGSSSAIWGANWRRDSEKPQMDWSTAGKSSHTTYQRRDQGIKVLKPLKSTRAFSAQASSPSPATGQSRFFDEGKRRASNESSENQLKRVASSDTKASTRAKENTPMTDKPRASNPATRVFTTATKKRKIAQPARDDDLDIEQGGPPTPLYDLPRNSDRSSPHSITPSTIRASASPPRYIPTHLHDEFFDHSNSKPAIHRGVSPFYESSAASSPTNAYAALSLHNMEDAPSSTGERRGSTPSGDAPHTMMQDRPGSPTTRQSNTPARSSSPAKRPASVLDDDTDTEHHQPMPVQPIENLPSQSEGDVSNSNLLPHSPSVDMSGLENVAPAATNTTVPSHANISPGREPAGGIPSLDEQYAQVFKLCIPNPEEGDWGYAISWKWLQRVTARTSERNNHEFDKSALEGDIGPIDNSSLVQDHPANVDLRDEDGERFMPLRSGLTMGQDYEIMPKSAWDLLLSWYGLVDPSHIIRRRAHNTAPDALLPNIQYELFPPVFTIRRVQQSTNSPLSNETAQPAPKVLASTSENFQHFLARIKEAAGVPMASKVQLWRLIHSQSTASEEKPASDAGIITPPSSGAASPIGPAETQPTTKSLHLPLKDLIAMDEGSEREMIDHQDLTTDSKDNGKATLHTLGLGEDSELAIEEANGGEEFVSTIAKNIKKGSKSSGGKPLASGAKDIRVGNSGRTSPLPSGMMTRGRTRRDGRTRGTVGLSNLGNTCYMNSALQCIRSVEELTMYFLGEHYKRELNSGNPIGYGGSVAKVYASLLASIYDDTESTSFSPKNFKNTLGRFAPAFSGYGQQDSQEFLSWLVDGLHEDLNRIHKKPYKENPDSDDSMANDPVAIMKLGEQFRANHAARNDSIAMDLFNGFYKNTVVCPDCDKVSITFDPYSLLTLQLPFEQTWQHNIYFMPLSSPPVKIQVDVDKNSSIRALKEYVSKRFPNTEWKKMVCAEVFSNKFYKIFEDKAIISESNIQANDEIAIYELEGQPTNYPSPKKKQGKASNLSYFNQESEDDIPESDSHVAGHMLVPIFHRIPTNHYNASKSLTLTPSFIMLTRDEAKDYESILRKVLARIQTMTSLSLVTEADPESDDSGSSEAVEVTGASAEDSPTVQARSVESEDGMVDILVNGNPSIDAAPTDSSKAVDTNANSSPPTSMHEAAYASLNDPDYILNNNQKELFQLAFKTGPEMILTSWNDTGKDYPLILSRVPRAPPSPSMSSDSTLHDSSDVSESEDVAEDSGDARPLPIEATEPSNEEEELQPNLSKHFGGGRRRNGKKNKKNKSRQNGKNHDDSGKPGKRKGRMMTYSKKGPRKGIDQGLSLLHQSFNHKEAVEDEDSPYLIRLGESILIDWTREGHEKLFGGKTGTDTMKTIEILDDPDLAAKRTKRAERHRSGVTLDDCFAETAKTEVLSEDNAWRCSRCQKDQLASKTLEIWTVPDILVIHLKRFSQHRRFGDKIDVLVDFPIEGLELDKHVGLTEDKSMVYDLFAVDNHYGGLGGGHYTAYAQNFYDKKWYNYNDSSVMQCNPTNAVSNAAYLLFYRRRQDAPVGPKYIRDLVHAARNPRTASTANSESNSRDVSPLGSGKDQRLDGSASRNGDGSSGAFHRAGAAGVAPHLGGAGAGAETGEAGGDPGMQMVPVKRMSHDDTLPAYDDDEGISMDTGDDINSGYMGPAAPWQDNANWTFETLNRNTSHEVDNDSMVGNEEEEPEIRMLTEFGDDDDAFGSNLEGTGGRPSSPSGPSSMDVHMFEDIGLNDDEDDRTMMDADVETVPQLEPSADPPVTELRFASDEPEDKHLKSD